MAEFSRRNKSRKFKLNLKYDHSNKMLRIDLDVVHTKQPDTQRDLWQRVVPWCVPASVESSAKTVRARSNPILQE